MITMITFHQISHENREIAMKLLKKNTEIACKSKGLISRIVYISTHDPLKGYSITSWETKDDMEAFLRDPDRPSLVTEGKDKIVFLNTNEDRTIIFTETDFDIYDQIASC